MLLPEHTPPTSRSKWSYYLASIPKLIFGFTRPVQTVRCFLGRSAGSPFIVTVRSGPWRYWVRSKMDLWTVKETVLDRFYERHLPPLPEDGVVIDVGSAFGDFAVYAATMVPRGRVLAFEPIPDSFELLERNIALNNLRNITATMSAVCGERGELPEYGYLSTDPGSCSMLDGPKAQGREGAQRFRLTWTTLVEALAEAGGSCALLKIDCEGGEYDIILRSPGTVFGAIRCIALEFHEQLTESTRADLRRRLEQEGFTVTVAQNPVHPYLGYLWAVRSGSGR